MIRTYDSRVAEEVGVNAAVLFQSIAWWCEHNRANGANIHEGKAWTFNSMKAFKELFPEFSAKVVRTALDKLRDKGFVEVGNFNKSPYDRTLWYCVGPRGMGYLTSQREPIHWPSGANLNDPEGQPIPVDTQLTTNCIPPKAPQEEIPFKEIVGMLNERCGTSFKATSESMRKHIRARWAEGFREEDFRRVIENKAREWENNPEMRPFLRPQTLFCTKFEAYLNQGAKAKGATDYSAYNF